MIAIDDYTQSRCTCLDVFSQPVHDVCCIGVVVFISHNHRGRYARSLAPLLDGNDLKPIPFSSSQANVFHLTTAPSSPTQPSSRTRPPSILPSTHKSQFPLPARLYLRRLPMRRDSGGGSGRRRVCRGRGSVSIVLENVLIL